MRQRSTIEAILAALICSSCAEEPSDAADATGFAALPGTSGSTASTAAETTDTTEAQESGSSDEGGEASTTTGEGETTGQPAVPRYERDIYPIWEASCRCHISTFKANANSPRLDLESGYDNLVGVQAWQAHVPLVTPGNLEQSYLWRKLNGTAGEVGGFPSPMPELGGDLGPDEPLSEAELDLIEAWILGGAPR